MFKDKLRNFRLGWLFFNLAVREGKKKTSLLKTRKIRRFSNVNAFS